LNDHKPYKFRRKAHKKNKPFRTKHKGPIKICVPKSEIIFVAEMLKRKGKVEIMVPGQWFLRHMT